MKKLDLKLHVLILSIYIIASPIVFGYLYPEPITGDGGLAYFFVLTIAMITSLTSIVLFITLNKYVFLEKTYKIKGLVPLILSSILMYCSGSRPHYELEKTFLLGNLILLTVLYIFYGIIFHKRIIVSNKQNSNQ